MTIVLHTTFMVFSSTPQARVIDTSRITGMQPEIDGRGTLIWLRKSGWSGSFGGKEAFHAVESIATIQRLINGR